MINKKVFLILVVFTIGSLCLKAQDDNKTVENTINEMLDQPTGYFYLNADNYPTDKKELPIGVFDSGTGGLTVFRSIIELDSFQNKDRTYGKDGMYDFAGEKFIYLGDLANMPYGNYHKENKVDLLQEHIIKDVQFLLSEKYYATAKDSIYKTDKLPVKSIVIACNTATAYGTKKIDSLMAISGLNIKVIGVIDAGVRGALSVMEENPGGIIGVMATVGTVSSKGYEKAIYKLVQKPGFETNIEVFSQGGIGIAEALDGDTDYYNQNTVHPYSEYKGPGLGTKQGIDSMLFKVYGFDFSESKMLCDQENLSDCSIMQINDPVNYMRFHLVSLMEQIRNSATQNKLKVLILGCTHYPFLTKEIHQILDELYDHKSKNGEYRYRSFMAEKIKLIDPAQNTALELYEYLEADSLFSTNNKLSESSFFISVPNQFNKNILVDSLGRFPYDYKYGRTAGILQEYVKRIPLSFESIDKLTLQRIKEQMPYIYSLIFE